MTKQEKIVVSAYTGILMCDFDDLHQYIEEKLGRPVWTHELASSEVQDEIKKKTKADFLALCNDGSGEGTSVERPDNSIRNRLRKDLQSMKNRPCTL